MRAKIVQVYISKEARRSFSLSPLGMHYRHYNSLIFSWKQTSYKKRCTEQFLDGVIYFIVTIISRINKVKVNEIINSGRVVSAHLQNTIYWIAKLNFKFVLCSFDIVCTLEYVNAEIK